jgi:anaerobic selenocysteine-containing dehydrogenase
VSLSRRRFLVLTAGGVAAACVGGTSRPGDALAALYANPAKNEWPAEFLQLPGEIQAMYRYAAVNEPTLKWFPCYCGCVAGGHRSNFDCYVREVLADGRVKLDTMSFG